MDKDQIIADARAMLVKARARGLRIATRYEQREGDPQYLFRACSSGGHYWGPLLASIDWYGDRVTAEETEQLLEQYACEVVRQEERREYERKLKEIHDAHYARWLSDPVNVPYRVPDELLREAGIKWPATKLT